MRFTVLSLTNGTSYAFELIAVNEGGPNDTELESTGIAIDNIIPVGPPTSPRNLTGTYGDAQVILSWDAPVSNGGTSIIRYDYRKKLDTETSWTEDWTEFPTAHWMEIM